MRLMQNAPEAISIIPGTLFSVLAGMVYIILLHEPGPVFYPFTAMVFLGGPLIAGTTAAVRSRPHLTMNGIAYNCFVNGKTGEIVEI